MGRYARRFWTARTPKPWNAMPSNPAGRPSGPRPSTPVTWGGPHTMKSHGFWGRDDLADIPAYKGYSAHKWKKTGEAMSTDPDRSPPASGKLSAEDLITLNEEIAGMARAGLP